MSRPTGPVRHPGMPAQPELPNETHGGPAGGRDADPYAASNAGHQTPYQQAPTGHAPQQPSYAAQEQGGVTPEQNGGQYGAAPYASEPGQYASAQGHYGQPQNGQAGGQGYAPTDFQNQQHAAPSPHPGNAAGNAPSNAGYEQPAASGGLSWADVNQPAPQPTAQTHAQHNAQGYADPASYAAQQPSQTQAFQDPTYSDPAQGDAARYEQPTAAAHPHAQYQHSAPPVQPTTPTAAPSGYDFAGYEAPQPQTTAQFDPAFQTQQDPNVDWGQAGFAPVAGAAGAVAPAQAGLDIGQPAPAEEGYASEDDFEYEDEEDTGRGGRSMLVAAALAGAIVIGGGMAYGYQSIFGTASTGKPPIVKGASGPAKVKPADPGGRKFAHTDSKIMGRLGSASGRTNDPSGSARRVSTLRIGRDGSVMAPTNPSVAGPTGNRMVSGLTLGGTPVAAVGADAANASPAANKPIVVNPPAARAPVAPVKVVAAKPVVPKVTPAKPTARVVTPRKPTPAPKKVALAKPAPVAVGPKPTGAGYVAVLASVPVSKTSRMDSLKQFADMQQKYGAALANKTPDVQQANLGAKGTYHRLIVGPPGSAQSARQVCTSLKSAGYPSCWVLAY